jgi:phosphoribosylanthranilate isomerase
VSTRIKFCGCTSLADVELARDAGAHYYGMIFAESPRRISWDAAAEIARNAPSGIEPVAVFVNPSKDEIARAHSLFSDLTIQLSGDESPAFVNGLSGCVIKAIHVSDQSEKDIERISEAYARSFLLFDTLVAGTYGGTGTTFDWSTVRQMARWRPCIISGGLQAENVREVIAAVRPYGVDVRSGIETDGRKDAAKMRAFVHAVRENDAA